MKTIEVEHAAITLSELLQLASDDNVVLRGADGKEFLLAEVDDFSQEVALARAAGVDGFSPTTLSLVAAAVTFRGPRQPWFG